jgi:hypothetical protein
VHRSEHLGGQLGHAPLVLGVEKAPQQADGDGFAVEVAERRSQRLLVQRPQYAVGPGALGHGHAQLGSDDRSWVADAQPVQLGPGLAAQLLEVREALRGEQRRARHTALEQRVRAHGHAVHEPLDVSGGGIGGRQGLLDGGHHALGLVVGRAGRLAGDEPIARQQGGVGEGAANVHADDHRRGR